MSQKVDYDNTIMVKRVDENEASASLVGTLLGALNGPRGKRVREAIIDAIKEGLTTGSVEIDGVRFEFFPKP